MRNLILIFSFLFFICSCYKQKEKVIISVNKSKTESKKSIQNIEKQNVVQIKKDTTDIPICKINGYDIVYDSFEQDSKIKIYYKKGKTKKLLLNPKFIYEDFTVHEVSIFKHKNDNFIYIRTGHTYGHSHAYLYYLNTLQMKTYQIKKKYITNLKIRKITDTLVYHHSNILDRDKKNNLTSTSIYHDKNHMFSAIFSSEFDIIKLGNNKFVLNERNQRNEKIEKF